MSWLVIYNSLPVEGKASCEDSRESEVHTTWETAEETTAQRISPHPRNIQQPARTSGLAADGSAIHRETTKMRHFRFSCAGIDLRPKHRGDHLESHVSGAL